MNCLLQTFMNNGDGMNNRKTLSLYFMIVYRKIQNYFNSAQIVIYNAGFKKPFREVKLRSKNINFV